MDDDFALDTERLRLRPYRREDVGELADMFADPEHMRFYPGPFTSEQMQAWVDRQLERYRQDGFGLWVIEDRTTGGILGTAGPTIQVVEDVREVELGWHVRPGHKGRGTRRRPPRPRATGPSRTWRSII